MGLDMYLTAKRYFWHNEELPKTDVVPDGFRVNSVLVDAGYWRKANAIHHWFVENVQDGDDNCREYHVSRDKLESLRDLCRGVLDGVMKPEDALPTKDGFFFGDTEYGDWYRDGLQNTVEIIDRALHAFPDEWSFYYQSSW